MKQTPTPKQKAIMFAEKQLEWNDDMDGIISDTVDIALKEQAKQIYKLYNQHCDGCNMCSTCQSEFKERFLKCEETK